MSDIRFAVRIFVRDPWFALVVIIILAFGIGANSAIFSVVNAMLVRPLPYPEGSRLVVIWDKLSKLDLERFPVTYANYLDYKTANRVFEDVAAFREAEFNLTAGDQTERISGIRISANLLPLIDAAPAAGRTLSPHDNQPGREPVALVSNGLWRRRFGADPGILGKNVVLDGNAVTIVGILSAGFSFSAGGPPPEIWVPLALQADPGRTSGAVELIGRLKSGITIQQARADLQSVARGIEEKYHPYRGPHGEDAGYGVRVESLRDELYGEMRRGLLALLTAVAFVLLIACANVASLLLAHAAERSREIAVRMALGASRLRITRQLLIESMVIALSGGTLGLALAFWGVRVCDAFIRESLPHLGRFPVDARVLGFTLLVSLATGLGFGVVPSFYSLGLNPSAALREASRGTIGRMRSGRLRRVLIIGEVALSLVLVIGAGLLIKSFARLSRVNPGFRAENLITARISLPENQYRDGHRVVALYRDLLDRVRTIPGVQAAAMVSRLPLTGGLGGDPFSIEGRAYDAQGKTPQVVNQQAIAGDYFSTMQIPLIQGRFFGEHEPAPVAIVNATMAKGFWPGSGGQSDAIGHRVVLGAPRSGAPWLTIVGVVGDVRNAELKMQPLPQMYVPVGQTPTRSMALVIRTGSDMGDIISAARGQLFVLDPHQPLYDVKTMQERVSADTAQPRFQTFLLGSFAVLAMILAAIGTYGVVARFVVERTHEIGVRMALGAKPVVVLIWILREGLSVGLAGIMLGVAGTLAVGQLLSSLLYDVSALDWPTFLDASLLLMGIVLAACYIPARKAAQLDPMVALRDQ